jgi:hypothetical protein
MFNLKKKIKFIFLGLLIISAFLFITNNALAQLNVGLNDSNITNTGLSASDPKTVLTRIITIFLGFLGLIAVVLVLYAGFLWMTSSGDEEKIEKAKKTLRRALIGLAIILASWGITVFVINKLMEATTGVTQPSGPTQSCTVEGATQVCGCAGSMTCVSGSWTSCIGGTCPPGVNPPKNCNATPQGACTKDDTKCDTANEYCGSDCTCKPKGGLGDSCTSDPSGATCIKDDNLCGPGLKCNDKCECFGGPIITNISPYGGFCNEDKNKSCDKDTDCTTGCNKNTPNGATGNLITIEGRNFGTVASLWDTKLATIDFEGGTLGQLPTAWTKTTQSKSSVGLTNQDKYDGTQSVLLHQEPNLSYPGTCEKNTCQGIAGCTWSDAQKQCQFTKADDCHVNAAIYEEGQVLCSPNTNKTMYSNLSYDVSSLSWELGKKYVVKFYYKGRVNSELTPIFAYDVSFGSQAVLIDSEDGKKYCADNVNKTAGNLGYPKCSSQTEYCCAQGPNIQKKPYTILQMPTIPAGVYTEWTAYSFIFEYSQALADLKNKTGQKVHNIGFVLPYQATGSGTDFYLDNLVVAKSPEVGTGGGKVVFLGDIATSSDDVTAVLPTTQNSKCVSYWQNDQIIVAVPAGAKPGPIQVFSDTYEMVDNQKQFLSDQSNHEVGPKINDFVSNTITRPGLCSYESTALQQPDSNSNSNSLLYNGVNFNSAVAYFGSKEQNVPGLNSSFVNSTEGQTYLPTINSGKTSTFVKNSNNQLSNFLNIYKAANGAENALFISGFDSGLKEINGQPKGRPGQYVTITGGGFGSERANTKVYFNNIEASYNFPSVCQGSTWSGNQIIVKIPDGLANGSYTLKIEKNGVITDSSLLSPNSIKIDNSLSLMPSICKIDPKLGPVASKVTLAGEYFGVAGNIGKVSFWQNVFGKDTGKITEEGTAQTLETTVPDTAKAGPITVVSDLGPGNSLNFVVGACTKDEDCAGKICCPSTTYNKGACVATADKCAVDIPTSVFEWSFNTKWTGDSDNPTNESCYGVSRNFGFCPTGYCPNSPGQCSPYKAPTNGEKQTGYDCNLGCEKIAGTVVSQCQGGACTYNKEVDKCLKNNTTCNGPEEFVYQPEADSAGKNCIKQFDKVAATNGELVCPTNTMENATNKNKCDSVDSYWQIDATDGLCPVNWTANGTKCVDFTTACTLRTTKTCVNYTTTKGTSCPTGSTDDGKGSCVSNRWKIEVPMVCPNNWTSIGNKQCVDETTTCGTCPTDFSCVKVTEGTNLVQRCAYNTELCEMDSYCSNSKCVVKDKDACECCCEKGQDKRDCCSGLTCDGTCGSGALINPANGKVLKSFGYCSGCAKDGQTQAQWDANCNCDGHQGKFCQKDATKYPTGACLDCSTLSATECTQHSACCLDAKNGNVCRGGEQLTSGTDKGYCAYYNCDPFNPTTCQPTPVKNGQYSSCQKCAENKADSICSSFTDIDSCNGSCSNYIVSKTNGLCEQGFVDDGNGNCSAMRWRIPKPSTGCPAGPDWVTGGSICINTKLTCSASSSCCFNGADGDNKNKCISGKALTSGVDKGYCAYYNCDGANPKICNSSNPLRTGKYQTIDDCTLKCAQQDPQLGKECSAKADATTCSTSVCNKFSCLKDDVDPANSCGTCCCDPSKTGSDAENLTTYDACKSLNKDLSCRPNQSPCSGEKRGLCCGCVGDYTCGATDSIGCGIDTCCHARPEIAVVSPEINIMNSTYPKHMQENVCTNTQLRIPFDSSMDASSLKDNIIVFEEQNYDGSSVCPAGTFLAQNSKFTKPTLLARIYQVITLAFNRTIGRLLSTEIAVADTPDPSKLYCVVLGTAMAEQGADGKTTAVFTPEQPLKSSSSSHTQNYFVVVLGDKNLDSKSGIKSNQGIGFRGDGYYNITTKAFVSGENISFNSLSYRNSYIFKFSTKINDGTSGVCAVDHVKVLPEGYLFQTAEDNVNKNDNNPTNVSFDTVTDSDKAFYAYAYSVDGQILVPVNGYSWTWTWTVTNPKIVNFADTAAKDYKDINVTWPTTGNARLVVAQSGINDASTNVNAMISMNSSNVSQEGNNKSANALTYVFVCRNPWPPVKNGVWNPYTDNCPTGVTNCSTYNFKFYYCRDAGQSGTFDDLPAIQSGNAIINGGSKVCSLSNKACPSGTECTGAGDGICIWNILKESYFFRELPPDVDQIGLKSDFEYDSLSAAGWWESSQKHSSVSLSSVEKYAGKNSLLIHQDPNLNYPGTCSAATCSVLGCSWNSTAKTCTFGSRDDCHTSAAVYHEGETLCWGNSYRTMWLSANYNVTNLDWRVGERYAVRFKYKGKLSSYLSSFISFSPGWASQSVYCANSYSSWCDNKSKVCSDAGYSNYYCAQAPAQTRPYSAVYTTNIPAGTYSDWQDYNYIFTFNDDLNRCKYANGNLQLIYALSTGYNSTGSLGTNFYIDDFSVSKVNDNTLSLVTNKGDGTTATVKWSYSTEAIPAFKVYYYVNGSTELASKTIDTSDATICKNKDCQIDIIGLEKNKEYNFQLTYVNDSAVESTFSEVIKTKVEATGAIVDQPLNLKASYQCYGSCDGKTCGDDGCGNKCGETGSCILGTINDTQTTVPSASVSHGSLFISGNYVYKTNVAKSTLDIIDISNLQKPKVLTSIANGFKDANNQTINMVSPHNVYISGTKAYIVVGGNALEIVDVSDPAKPKHLGYIANGQSGVSDPNAPKASISAPHDLFVLNGYVYIANYLDNSLEIIDASDSKNPKHAGKMTGFSGPVAVAVKDNYAYVASFHGNDLRIIDVSDPKNPKLYSKLATGDGNAIFANPRGIDINNDRAYIANSAGSVEVVDISIPQYPKHLTNIADGKNGVVLKGPMSVRAFGNSVAVANLSNDTVEIIDFSNLEKPSSFAHLTAGGIKSPYYVGISDKAAFVAGNGGNAFQVVDISPYFERINVRKDGKIFLSWDKLANAASYKLYYGVKTGCNYGDKIKVTNGPCFAEVINVPDSDTLGYEFDYSKYNIDLQPIYYFAVSAVDENGYEGDKSKYLKVNFDPLASHCGNGLIEGMFVDGIWQSDIWLKEKCDGNFQKCGSSAQEVQCNTTCDNLNGCFDVSGPITYCTEKDCPTNANQPLSAPPLCTNWTYSNWSTCLSTGLQKRVALSTSPDGCSGGSPVLSRACVPTCTFWTYSDWDICADNGTQTRTITSSFPDGCDQGEPEPLMQTCVPTCKSWTYSDWSSCSDDGLQTRTIISSSPNGCAGGSPILTKACVPTCKSWTYSDWGTCADNGTQTRTITSSYPNNCTGGTPASLTQSCTPACRSYTYSAWGTCADDGTQTRTVATTTPATCTGGVAPILNQTCIPTCRSWTYSGWSICSDSGSQTRTITSSYPNNCAGGTSGVLTQSCTPACRSYTYSAWGTCADDSTQTRTITTSTPSTCAGGVYPILTQSCTPTCRSWTYSGWSVCADDSTQTRTITSAIPSGCAGGNSATLTQSCTPTCKSWTYSAWGTCSDSGSQTRTITSSAPANCAGGTPASLTQSCTPACRSYTYSGWGTCADDGTQTRTVATTTPSSCSGGTAPVLTQSCTPACRSYTYSGWGTCSDSGTQTRTITAYTPATCSGGVSPVLSQSCTPVCRSYTYSAWGTCSDSGTQTRTVATTTPSSCSGGTAPVLTQSCTPACRSYNYSSWSACVAPGTQSRTVTSSVPTTCSGGTAPVLTQTCTPPACTSWTYSNWSACSSNFQTRSVTSSSPAGCMGGSPLTSQACIRFNNPQDLATIKNYILHYNSWGTNYAYAKGFCQIVKGCTDYSNVGLIADGLKACRCDAASFGCTGGSCTNADGSAWSRFSYVECTGCP